MPPPLPRGGQGLVLRPAPTMGLRLWATPRVTAAVPAATATISTTRQFTTSRPLSAVQIPPESPDFISVPTPPQSTYTPRPRVKGRLPVPRRVFDLGRSKDRMPGSRRSRPDPRLRPEAYVAKTMPRSKDELAGKASRTPTEEWKRAMADSRRAALAEGLAGLLDRQRSADRQARRLARGRAQVRREAAERPERPDEALTRPTVRGATALTTAVAPDPHRFARAAASARRTGLIARAKSEARRDALQELYLASRDFIVTEEELESRVEALFSERHFGQLGTAVSGVVRNMWDLKGPPATLKEALGEFARVTSEAGGASASAREVARQKAVSEELTGGKLPSGSGM